VKFSQRVAKMKLAKDKQSLYVNDSLTLADIRRRPSNTGSARAPHSNGSSINTR